MEPEVPFLCSQEPATAPYSESDEHSLYFFQVSVTSSLLGPSILLSALLTNTLIQFFFP
jgi:hypothetical protein